MRKVQGGDGNGRCKKQVYLNMCLILKGYRDTAI